MADVAVSNSMPPLASVTPPPVRWPLLQRAAFRFFCAYFLLYAMPEQGRVSLLSAIPFGAFAARPWTRLWHWLTPWTAIHVFHLSGQAVTYFRTGSGDTTLAYVENLLYAVIAAVAAAIWSILDRKRPNYTTLHGWLRLLVRYTLAFTLFGYGSSKFFRCSSGPQTSAA